MIQKAAAMGTWWLAVSSQRAHSRITSRAEFFGKTSNHPDDSAPLQPRSGALWLLVFPKTKITFEREEISDHWWNSGKYDGAADGDWENCVRSQGTYFEGDWGVIVLCTMFFVSCIFFNKCLYFSYYVAGYLLESPRMHMNLSKLSTYIYKASEVNFSFSLPISTHQLALQTLNKLLKSNMGGT